MTVDMVNLSNKPLCSWRVGIPLFYLHGHANQWLGRVRTRNRNQMHFDLKNKCCGWCRHGDIRWSQEKSRSLQSCLGPCRVHCASSGMTICGLSRNPRYSFSSAFGPTNPLLNCPVGMKPAAASQSSNGLMFAVGHFHMAKCKMFA